MYSSTVLSLAVLPAAFAQLNTLAKAAGKLYFGSETDNSELTNTAYTPVLSSTSEFGQITPGNTMKWLYTEPTQNSFTYSQGDVIAAFAEKNGQLLRCHNLVWYEELPSWVTSDTWTNATLIAAMEAHITSEVTHYKGQCYAWDVVNEALNDDGTYRSNIFYQTIGPQYIAIAFKTAAAADPAAKLYYNDYNIESPGAKATAAQHIVSSLKAQGVKIDGVGLESHFIVGETPSQASQLANMKTFMALGVNVAVTELDVRFSSLPPTTAGLAQQSADYASTVGACVAAGPGCVGITVWDFDDEYSWIPSTFPGEGEADLWNSDLTKKPAYAGVVAALKSGGGSPPSPVSLTTTAKSTTFATSTIRPTTSTSVPATSPTSVPLYGQCGGIGYTGSTVCAIGSTCKVISAYYSQCL